MQNFKIFFLLSFLFVGFGNLNAQQLTSDNAMVNQLLRPEWGGIFRGMHFNMPIETVKSREVEAELVDETPQELVFKIDMSEYEYAEIYYSWNDAGDLETISLETYMDLITDAEELAMDIKAFLDKRLVKGVHNEMTHRTNWLIQDSRTDILFEVVLEELGGAQDAGLYLDFNRLEE